MKVHKASYTVISFSYTSTVCWLHNKTLNDDSMLIKMSVHYATVDLQLEVCYSPKTRSIRSTPATLSNSY